MSYTKKANSELHLDLWMTGIDGIKKDKRYRILCELVSVKKSLRQPPFA